MMRYINARKAILLITFIFLLVRLPFLDQTFLLHDERDTTLTQYSIAKTGKDLYGNTLPLQFERISPQAPFLAMYYGVPFWFFGLPKTVSAVRLIYLLPATLLPLLVFELINTILKRKNLAIITSLVFSFSPWVYHISRLGLEINLAFPLFLIGVIMQIKRKPSFLFYLFYFLSFFSYQGIRPLIPIVMLYIEGFYLIKDKNIKASLKKGLIHILVFLIFVGMSMPLEGGFKKRGNSEIVFLSTERLKNEVNHNRFISTAPPKIKALFDNKPMAAVNYLTGNFLEGLSFSYLFKNGDYVKIYSNGVGGQFFPLFSLFFLLGLMILGKEKKPLFFYTSGFVLIGLVPSVINIYSLTFSIRSLFSGVGLSFIIGLGIYAGCCFLRDLKHKQKTVLLFFMVFLIASQAVIFSYRYFFQHPVWSSEDFNEQERKLGQFLIKENRPYTIYSTSAFTHFVSYLFLHDFSSKDLSIIQQVLNKSTSDFKINSVSFKSCKPKEMELLEKPHGQIIDSDCLTQKSKEYFEYQDPFSFSRLYLSSYENLNSKRDTKFYIFK